ncbi:spore germination protein [Paenibacillus sp. BC26]|uniref:spore germination protein n=1 Tax=Paenibacillus sp. BC26 TaxID=1881032 RepID=UPI0008E4D89F|nr:spore germination protein [Paenibacillus sp. BC26]SFS53984.1 GerA spore germination protein [Paenibacillus sp. BC26]
MNQEVEALVQEAHDVKLEHIGEISLLYCESLVNMDRLKTIVIPNWKQMIQNNEWKPLEKSITEEIFAGAVVMFPDQLKYELPEPRSRSVEESTSEVSIKGPRDGFTEEVETNVALIRKRMKTTSLNYEQVKIGRRGNSTVALLYCKDITNESILKELRARLAKIDIDVLLGAAQLEEYLSDSPNSIFPLVDYIGRPDFAVQALMTGRFVILIDGSPMAIIGPINFLELIKSPEDIHFPFYYTIFQRMLRFVGLMVAMFLPGFWVSLFAYNIDQLPFPLLSTLVTARLGIPYPAPIETFIILGLFEMFREAGIRLPTAVGQTVAVVGGLIIGDAAIRSGLASPSMLMVTASAVVATFTLVNQSLSGTVTLIRIYVLLVSCILGLFGFFIASLSVIAYMATLKSFGVPYLEPISQMKLKPIIISIINLPFHMKRERFKALHPKDKTK